MGSEPKPYGYLWSHRPYKEACLNSKHSSLTASIALHASFANNLVVVVLRLVLFNMYIYTLYSIQISLAFWKWLRSAHIGLVQMKIKQINQLEDDTNMYMT